MKVKADKDQNGSPVLTIATPPKTDPIATVVALEFASAPEIDLGATAVHAEAGWKHHAEGDRRGGEWPQGETRRRLPSALWTDIRDAVLWDFVPKAAGNYQSRMTYACPEPRRVRRSRSTLATPKPTPRSNPPAAKTQWKTAEVGTVDVGTAMQTLMIRPTKIAKDSVMNLKSVKLTPIH